MNTKNTQLRFWNIINCDKYSQDLTILDLLTTFLSDLTLTSWNLAKTFLITTKFPLITILKKLYQM